MLRRNIRPLSLASHSVYVYPIRNSRSGVLVEVAEHVYPVDFVILDIKENEKMASSYGTPFLQRLRLVFVIKLIKGTITLRIWYCRLELRQ
ncbi:hypothetical protein Tco_0513887 [Tanacetum coccineum]